MATDLYQPWSHRWGGIATLQWTDPSGMYSVSTSASVAADRDFCHLSLAAVKPDERDAAPVDLGFAEFASWLEAKMNAVSARAFQVQFDPADLIYEISIDSGAFALSFSGAAGARMRRILGFTGGNSPVANRASNMRPWYVNRAVVDGRSNYRPPTVVSGQVRSARADDGQPYSLAPTRLVKSARWEHWFEPAEAIRRADAVSDTTIGGASWTWEDALEHAARYGVPCVVRDSREAMVFYTSTPLEEGATRLVQKSYYGHQIVVVSADAIAGYL